MSDIKKIIILICIIWNTVLSAANPSPSTEIPATIKDPATIVNDELLRLDMLIQATSQSLEAQKRLRVMIVEYQMIHEQFLKNPNDNEVLLNVVKSAHKILQSIKENHLTYTFDTNFIDELTILSQPASKRGIPKP